MRLNNMSMLLSKGVDEICEQLLKKGDTFLSYEKRRHLAEAHFGVALHIAVEYHSKNTPRIWKHPLLERDDLNEAMRAILEGRDYELNQNCSSAHVSNLAALFIHAGVSRITAVEIVEQEILGVRKKVVRSA